jgi:hypothetical protein
MVERNFPAGLCVVDNGAVGGRLRESGPGRSQEKSEVFHVVVGARKKGLLASGPNDDARWRGPAPAGLTTGVRGVVAVAHALMKFTKPARAGWPVLGLEASLPRWDSRMTREPPRKGHVGQGNRLRLQGDLVGLGN